VELESQADEVRSRGYGIAVISYDPQEATARFTEQQGISFPMLSDVGSETIRRYGLLNPVPEWAVGENKDDPIVQADVAKYVSVINPSERMIGISFPGTLMLDTSGRVTSRYFEDFYIERNTVSSIIIRLGEGRDPVRAVRLSTAQLDLTTYASESTLAAGNRFAVMMSVEPHDGMHVYAPGADDYRVISLNIEPQPYVSVLPLQYGEASDYYFEPFDETVPVYEEPFELVQELILEGTLEAQAAMRGQESLTVNGTFEYQACSATICYPPQAVELSWTVPLRSLVFGPRPPRP
jgi:peroxiredoxin